MTEKEIMEVVGNNWVEQKEESRKGEDPIVLSVEEIGAHLIMRAAINMPELPPEERLQELLRINRARSKLSYFVGIRQEKTRLSLIQFKNLGLLYKAWECITQYLHDHYEEPWLEELKKEATKESLKDISNGAALTLASYVQQLTDTRQMALVLDDFEKMDRVFTYFTELVLGKELFIKFRKEFNEAMTILRRLQPNMHKEQNSAPN
ncbi:MAG: hypothetical protein WED06_01525 [Candidatus Paceibacterota bacterium]